MKKNEKKKGFAKTVLGIVGVIGLVSALGLGSVAYAAGASLNGKVDVPTKYALPDSDIISILPEKIQAERNYTIADNSLSKETPTKNVISRDQAADIGAAELTKAFGIDLSGRKIDMTYYTSWLNENQTFWSGSILISGDHKTGQVYHFDMNANTGEIHSMSYTRSIDANVSLDFDSAIAKNPTEFESLAKKIAEEHDVVGGKVRSAAYAAQGYVNNDPDVMILVIGENGQRAQLQFSRYDKMYTGTIFEGGMKEIDLREQWAEE